MATWNIGKVIEHKQWSKSLHSLYVESDIEPFEAGQFVKIALTINGEIIGRPYSMVNSPNIRPLEFYYIEVPNGSLTPNLSTLRVGDEILVAPKAHGFLILDELPQARHLWMMATGTGIGPFLSILATEKPWIRFERVILVYAVRYVSELSYQERIAKIFAKHSKQFSFIPFVSRETVDLTLTDRIPQAIVDGRLESHAGIDFSSDHSQVMLCGNPQMVRDTSNVLIGRGLKKHRRFDPGNISIENYW